MIFLDTSAIYAAADKSDDHHAEAKGLFEEILDQGETLLIHNYIIVESLALLQNRLSQGAAEKFLESIDYFTIVWVNEPIHHEATRRFEKAGSRALSFVDCVSFAVMQEKKVRKYFGFDRDFDKEGYQRLSLT